MLTNIFFIIALCGTERYFGIDPVILWFLLSLVKNEMKTSNDDNIGANDNDDNNP
jgi:hypothetical protein